MSNTVTSYIMVHDGGKLTVEDVNLAVHGVHPLPTYGEEVNYYSASQGKDSEWIKVRTKWSAPVGAIAQLAYEKGINLTLEFDSLDNSEIGSMQFYYRREALEAMGEIGVLDYYRPGAVPQEVRDADARYARKEDEETRKAFGVEEAR
jgi:hypothetical protein